MTEGGSMSISITRTDRTVVVVADGDITPEQWLVVCDQHGLRGEQVAVDDYTTDGDRHSWMFTLLPQDQQLEASK